MNKRIVFIEDDEVLRDVGAEALRLGGYDVFAAATAGQALAHLGAGGDAHCILLDLGLPDMNADEFRRQLTSLPRAHSIPVVLASGRGDIDLWAERLGVTHVMPKPYDFCTLMRVVEEASR